MFHWAKLLVIFLQIYKVTSCDCSLDKNEDEGELQLVSIIFRHGARTPSHFYPNDPHENHNFYPFAKGGLTNQGKMDEFQLGKYLRNLYGDFLGEDYTETKVWVRSTDFSRTKMSAQLVLAGLFPPSTSLMWNEELNWQPIPVNYKSEEEEDLLHPTKNCDLKKHVLKTLPELAEVQNLYIEPYKDIYNYVEKNSGEPIKMPFDLQRIFITLQCESKFNLTLPEWTETIFPEKLESAVACIYAYHNHNPEVRKINSGYILKKILDDFKLKINDGNLDSKIFLYSGHETTVGYMLDALKAEDAHIPDFGSAICFELRKKVDEYFIKLRYRNSTNVSEPKDLNIPGCDVLCPYEKFVKLLDYVIPKIPIEEACLQEAKKSMSI